MSVKEGDFSSLIEAKVLLIKLINRINGFILASFKNKCVNFTIIKNKIYRDTFKGKIVILNFSLEEIRDIRLLLLAIGLKERFSSKLVKEVIDVRGDS